MWFLHCSTAAIWLLKSRERGFTLHSWLSLVEFSLLAASLAGSSCVLLVVTMRTRKSWEKVLSEWKKKLTTTTVVTAMRSATSRLRWRHSSENATLISRTIPVDERAFHHGD